MTDGARYTVARIDARGQKIWLQDLDDGKSITNDAAAVAFAINRRYAGWRILYRDTMGNWDELLHEDGRFTGFAPARELALLEEMT